MQSFRLKGGYLEKVFVKLPIKLLKYFLFFALSLFGCVTPSRDSAISCDILKKPRDILKVEDLYQSSVVGKFYVSALSRRSENLFFLSNLSEVVGSKPEKNNRFLKIQGRPIGIASFGMKDYLASFSDSESKITLFGLGQEKTVKVISVGTKAIPISAIGKYVLVDLHKPKSKQYNHEYPLHSNQCWTNPCWNVNGLRAVGRHLCVHSCKPT